MKNWASNSQVKLLQQLDHFPQCTCQDIVQLMRGPRRSKVNLVRRRLNLQFCRECLERKENRALFLWKERWISKIPWKVSTCSGINNYRHNRMPFRKSSHEEKNKWTQMYYSFVGTKSIWGNITLTWPLAFQFLSWLVMINNCSTTQDH